MLRAVRGHGGDGPVDTCGNARCCNPDHLKWRDSRGAARALGAKAIEEARAEAERLVLSAEELKGTALALRKAANDLERRPGNRALQIEAIRAAKKAAALERRLARAGVLVATVHVGGKAVA